MTWIFWIALVFVFYTYAGYLMWLSLASRFRAIPVQKGEIQPAVSFVIAVRNEEKPLRTSWPT
jgi:hypothetical protein